MPSTALQIYLILLLGVLVTCQVPTANIYAPSDAFGPVGQRRCFRPTRIEIPECKNLFYNFTAFPNLVGQESQLDARHQLQTFKPLITYKCSNHLTFFLCSVYAPMCDVNTNHLIGPCRPLCEKVRKRCSPVLKIFNFDWPANLNCSRFPEKNTVGGDMCMKGPDIPEDFDKPPSGEVDYSEELKAPLVPDIALEVVKPPPLVKEKPDFSTEGFLRQLGDLPSSMGGSSADETSKIGSHLQTWLARIHDSSLSTDLDNEETPVALLVSSLRFCSHLAKPTSYIYINRTGRCAPHCTADILFSPSAKKLATVWTSVISGLCLIATTGTLLSFAIQPSLFHTLERPVIYIAGCQLAYALGFAVRLKLGRKSVTCGKDPASGFAIRLQEGLDNSNCALVFLIQYYFFTAGAIWWAMMVVGWATRSTNHLRLARGRRRDDSGQGRSSCRCWQRDNDGNEPIGDMFGDKQPRIGSSMRFAQLSRRGVHSSSADNNCLAKEHVIAWLTPGLLTMGVLVSRQVDADELLGICSVGRQNTKAMLIFTIIPQLVFLVSGLLAFVCCLIQLYKIKVTMRQRQPVPSATMVNLDAQSRYHVYQSDQHSEFATTVVDNSEVGALALRSNITQATSCCGCQILRWDSLSTRLGFFSILYIVPAITVFACDFYEYLNRDRWLSGDPISAISQILKPKSSPPLEGEHNQEITPEVFLLRTFMSLVTGFATCLWMLSVKGIEPWRYLGRQLENRCAGKCCFGRAQLKTQPQPTQQQRLRPQQTGISPQPSQGLSSKNTPSNTSTVLHPYAVYQHCCSTNDAIDRCQYTVRPPAGPGVDATDQFFVQPSGGLALPSPNQASGYYSSATTTNNSVGSGSAISPRPPPNTPPGTVNGDSNPGSSAAGGWWELNNTHLHTHNQQQQQQQQQQQKQQQKSNRRALL